MVIMETLRLHPILPLLVPHLCRKTCDIGGYEVSKGSMVGINAWATARNPKYWDNPEEFRPTRFENTTCDYKGSEFHYLPFGSGRRMCPVLSFGVAVLELIVARLLYYFDWSLPGKMLPEELDMDITVGATAKRRNQLHLVATPYDVPIPFEN
ncbi:cytochrome P450 99A2-like [Miscanthus floridulus]